MDKVKVNSDVELKDKLVAINRVTKVTKGGRTFTFAAIVVVMVLSDGVLVRLVRYSRQLLRVLRQQRRILLRFQ